ncbi:hypothetical protein FKM82_028212 [Ascaphus truei]
MVSKRRFIFTSIEFPGISTLNPFSMRSNELDLEHGVLWTSGWMGAEEDEMGVRWREASAKCDGGGDLWISGRETTESSKSVMEKVTCGFLGEKRQRHRTVMEKVTCGFQGEAAASSKIDGGGDLWVSGRAAAASSRSDGIGDL